MNIKVLIANRGEISNRIIRTCKKLNITTYCIYTQEDAHALNVKNADYALLLPSGPLSKNYLNASLIVELAKQHGVHAIHPGYGFLSESCQFASMAQKVEIKWIGPTIRNIQDFGSKHHSKLLAKQAGIPILDDTPIIQNSLNAIEMADLLGYPIMIKGSDAGGGIGMFKCSNKEEVQINFPIAQQKSRTFFNSDAIFLEKFLQKAHHIQIQIVGDGKGNAIALGQRQCSAQRRNQKVIEETPSPFIDERLRQEMKEAAVRLAKRIRYQSVGTVEFIVDHETRKFYFLEVNTRLQVEHPITEMTFGIDLVELMINIAFNRQIDWEKINRISKLQKGHAIEARVYAENPLRDFKPSPGRISCLKFPQQSGNLRIDTWIENDITISHCYDPLLAKIITYGETREIAARNLLDGLKQTKIQGIQSNLQFLGEVISSQTFKQGYNLTTNFLNQFTYTSYSVEVVEAGVYSLIQDYPGRVGYWNVGVPPSGPMDSFSFQIANFLVGNSGDEAGIEIVLDGMTLKFNCDAMIAVTGSQAQIIVNNELKQMYTNIFVKQGSEVKISLVSSKGCRSYVGIKGGIQVEDFLGSKSTFPAGKFGGLSGNCLQKGDFLHLLKCQSDYKELTYPLQFRPQMTNQYTILAMAGPHYAPDYFTKEDIKKLWSHCFVVNHNSNRLGIRLSGFNAQFAREDGGDAGLHPSNIHDYPYAIGSMNISGNTPIILTLDGPSLGGFACPLTVIQSEMWKIGQLRAGDRVYFKQVDYDYAVKSKVCQQNMIRLQQFEQTLVVPASLELFSIDPVVETIRIDSLTLKFRAAGESHLLCDLLMDKFGLENRFVVELLLRTMKDMALDGILEFIPGVSSLLIKYNSNKIKIHFIINQVKKIIYSEKSHKDLIIPCRTVSLPIAFRDQQTLLAIQRYQKTIRSDAPYLPDNCEFVKTINDIPSLNALAKKIEDTTYLVLGLGDVYLGSPCAVPLDPRHRILTTKYDPARTYTPQGAVGIGGIYMCHYGMDSPGGYQLMGRSIPIWYTYHSTPWLLDFFDQVKYYLVSEEQLSLIRKNYRSGKFQPKIEKTQFSFKRYIDFLDENKLSIDEYEREHTIKKIASKVNWSVMKNATNLEDEPEEKIYTQEDGHLIKSKLCGNLYQIMIKEGDFVKVNQQLMHIEVMKMSITITSSIDGQVIKILKKEGKIVKEGEIICIIKPN